MASPQGKLVVPLGINPNGILRTLELDASDFLKVALASPETLDTHVYGYDPTTWRPLLVDASGRAIIVGTGASGRVPVSVAEELPAGTQNIGDVDVASSALPSGASTSANQSTEITALQLIDDLRNALATVATDKLRAEIVDALVAGSARIGSVGAEGYIGGAWQKGPIPFGYSGFQGLSWSNTSLPAGYSANPSATCPAGEIWRFTAISGVYFGASATNFQFDISDGAVLYPILLKTPPVSGAVYIITGEFIVPVGGAVTIEISGATLNDDVYGFAVGSRIDIDQ